MIDTKALVSALQATAPDPAFKLRQGVIVSVAADYTVTVTIGGSTTQVTGVSVASHTCPIPGATCWLATDGTDWMVLATLAPTGPAYGSMRKSVAQSIPNAAWTAMTWASRTDTIATGTTLGSDGVTIGVPGLYSVTLSSDIGGTQTAGTHYVRITKGGVAMAQGSAANFPTTSTFVSRTIAAGIFKCAVGDVINGEVYQNAGAARDQDIAAGQNVISLVWIGPSV